jgi:hypothetical protein
VNADGDHDFVFERDDVRIAIQEGLWRHFQATPQRVAQRRENEISYVWDALTERFSHHAMAGTQYYTNQADISGT